MFSAVSLAFFFLNMATFTALGVVLYTMVADLHWSYTAAGYSFSLLGVASGLTSPLGAVAMRLWGGRATIVLGCASLCLGFIIASLTHFIAEFFVAMILLGLGYSLAGNVVGVFLVAGWFSKNAPRIIGLYMMLGALGAAAGPPLVATIVLLTGWRGQWQTMAALAALTGLAALILIREPPHVTAGPPTSEPLAITPRQRPSWTPRQAIFTPQFTLVAAAMTMTMAGITTYSNDTVAHLVHFGDTATAAAWVLSAMALTATLVKGASGRLCEVMPSTTILAAGLAMQAIGNLILARAETPILQYAGALSFGTGWGLAYVAGTIVLLDYFGTITGSKILSIVWLITTAAAIGPIAAGRIADSTGSFSPLFNAYALLLILLAIPTLFMRQPAQRGTAPAPAQ